MNMNNIANQVRQMMTNPQQVMNRLNIPQNLQNNPQGAIQHLMNSGAMSQQQFNQLQNMANQMRSNPIFGGLFK